MAIPRHLYSDERSMQLKKQSHLRIAHAQITQRKENLDDVHSICLIGDKVVVGFRTGYRTNDCGGCWPHSERKTRPCFMVRVFRQIWRRGLHSMPPESMTFERSGKTRQLAGRLIRQQGRLRALQSVFPLVAVLDDERSQKLLSGLDIFCSSS